MQTVLLIGQIGFVPETARNGIVADGTGLILARCALAVVKPY